LESTISILLLTRECNLWNLGVKLIDDLAIDDLTHLVILFDGKSTLVTSPIHPMRHQRSTGFICLTQITVYSAPTWLAITRLLIGTSDVSAFSIGERVAG
jgi:hypothetical protein